MPKWLEWKYIEKILLSEGFIFISQKGSHKKYRLVKSGKSLTVILPCGLRELPFGTFRSVVKQSGLPHEKFTG